MDGSGRLTKRNRRFLRPIKAYKDMITQRAEPVHDHQPVDRVARPREVAHGVTDTAGYSSLLPEVMANGPNGVVLDQTVRMSDKYFDAGLSQAVENVLRNGDGQPNGVANGNHPGSGNVEPVEAVGQLRRSARNVQRPVSYGR